MLKRTYLVIGATALDFPLGYRVDPCLAFRNVMDLTLDDFVVVQQNLPGGIAAQLPSCGPPLIVEHISR